MLKNLLSKLNPHALRVGLVVAGAFLAIWLMVSGAEYATGWLARRHLAKQHAQAVTEHQARQAAGQAAGTRYQLDSAARATQRHQLLAQDSILATQEREILSTRPARLLLPAAGELPREGTK